MGNTLFHNQLPLSPTTPVGDALTQVLRRLFETIQQTEPGVRQATDIEYLHDYRVAIRRTRAVLRQFQFEITSPNLRYFRKEFKWLGRETGPMRDLDVFEVRLIDYVNGKGLDGDEVQEGLNALVVEKKAVELQNVVCALESDRCRDLMETWEDFLASSAPTNSESALHALVSNKIWSLYNVILKQGRAILSDSLARAAAYHRLRIECKRLRYMMELFSSLYSPKALAPLVQHLKNLQDTLGAHQDYIVHRNIIATTTIDEVSSMSSTISMTALVSFLAHLEQLAQKERKAIPGQFKKFTRRKASEQYRTLFENPGSY